MVDITNSLSPQIVGSVDTPGWAYGVAVSGTHAYVADGSSGLQVIDITDPESPQIVVREDTPGWAIGVAIFGTHAYVADEVSGLQVIDITNPLIPQIVGSVGTQGWAFGVAISGTHVYIADRITGLWVIQTQCQATSGVELETPALATHLLDAYPNPFNPQITIAFDLPGQAVVSLRVFDISGRLVRVLLDGELVAEGRREMIWNGRSDRGQKVAAGVYFYRLDGVGYSETKRMALVK